MDGALVFVTADQSNGAVLSAEAGLAGAIVVTNEIVAFSVDAGSVAITLVDFQLAEFTLEAPVTLTPGGNT